jgi:hypothetical protein
VTSKFVFFLQEVLEGGTFGFFLGCVVVFTHFCFRVSSFLFFSFFFFPLFSFPLALFRSFWLAADIIFAGDHSAGLIFGFLDNLELFGFFFIFFFLFF